MTIKPNTDITIHQIIEMMGLENSWDKSNVLSMIEKFNAEEFGPCKSMNLNYVPSTSIKISLRFNCEPESWITIPADHPILANYYDVVPESIEPAEENTLAIWIRDQDFFPAWTIKRRCKR